MGKELTVVETDNIDSENTILRLSNGDYVEVNVIDLYENIKENNEDDEQLVIVYIKLKGYILIYIPFFCKIMGKMFGVL